MAQRNRKYWIRYGGEQCGVASPNYTPKFVPAFSGLHSCIDETHPGPPYRSGGPLAVAKKKVYIQRFSGFSAHYHPTLGWYDGFMYIPPYIPSPEPSKTNLSGWGAKGWNRTIPLHPIYQLGVSIGELKDFPGMVSQTLRGFRALRNFPSAAAGGFRSVREFLRHASKAPRSAGDAYLYGAFGLAPMLQDLLFLLRMREKLERKLRWLRNKNGKSVRRKVELNSVDYWENIPRNAARSTTVGPILSSYLYPAGQSDSQPFPIRKLYQQRIWYSAKYRIRIPELDHWRPGDAPPMGLSADLLGLSPDPAIIYKLMPWSWLLDWFTSVGAVISNIYIRSKAQVLAEYAYVMCRETLTYECPGAVTVHSGTYGVPKWTGGDLSFAGVSRTIYEFRTREVANPYGFGLTFASLSAYQWSILVALGLSRGGKSSAPRT